MTYEVLKNDDQNRCHFLGFINHDSTLKMDILEQLNVYTIEDITDEFIKNESLEEVIIAIQTIETIQLIEIVIQLLNLNLTLKIIPQTNEFENGAFTAEQLKDLNIEDLLMRQSQLVVSPLLSNEYDNQIILITGAAGSIGRELARKLTAFKYKQLLLIDTAESALYELQQEFIQMNIPNFKVIVADIRDYYRFEQLFKLYTPKIIFHAAAYKHVPLMEDQPYEAVNVNIKGTKNIADLSIKYGVHKFVLISTDKAVNPTNVMGATKRIAELYINGLRDKGQTKFITTRFGNVLASNGSVIPLFKKQIDSGGPITVTDTEIKRFFISISGACNLVLEAASIGIGGELFVFDMGESIKIYDLAVMMIKLSGYRFPEDVAINITGLRPGEKVIEELWLQDEVAKSTYHEKIKVAKTITPQNPESLQKILALCDMVAKLQNLEIVALIKAIIPEYHSNNSKFGLLDDRKKSSL
jgi:FlaA1/EpsC-like NDP-sugar epimerase